MDSQIEMTRRKDPATCLASGASGQLSPRPLLLHVCFGSEAQPRTSPTTHHPPMLINILFCSSLFPMARDL